MRMGMGCLGSCVMSFGALWALCIVGGVQDQDVFFKDYVEAHTKMAVAGCKDTSPAFWGSEASKAEVSSGAVLGQAAIGFAATAIVLVLGYMNELRRKTK